jgi:hypothetical protein
MNGIGSPPVGTLPRIAVALVQRAISRDSRFDVLPVAVSGLINCRFVLITDRCCRRATDAVQAQYLCNDVHALRRANHVPFLWIVDRCKFCGGHEITLVEFTVSGGLRSAEQGAKDSLHVG